jgi:hypothetical protein
MTIRKLIRFMLWCALSAAAQAQFAPEAGMVTRVEGAVTYSAGSGATKPVVSFMKVRKKDRFTVPDAANIQIVFFAGAVQETWKGPVEFVIEAQGGKGKGGEKPEVRKLPSSVITSLTKAPSVLSDIKNRQGMVFVRAAGHMEKVRQMEEAYRMMREEAPEDDITPELFLLSRLYELQMYRDVPGVFAEIRRRQPNNTEVDTLEKNYEAMLGNQPLETE